MYDAFHEKEGNLVKMTFSQQMHSAPITGSMEGLNDYIDLIHVISIKKMLIFVIRL